MFHYTKYRPVAEVCATMVRELQTSRTIHKVEPVYHRIIQAGRGGFDSRISTYWTSHRRSLRGNRGAIERRLGGVKATTDSLPLADNSLTSSWQKNRKRTCSRASWRGWGGRKGKKEPQLMCWQYIDLPRRRIFRQTFRDHRGEWY